jgi:PEP-CTERM motif-containing protein
MRLEKIVFPVLVLFAIICSVSTARADSVTFTVGNNPQSDEENILLNSGATGTTVFGLTNQTQLQVAFSSTTDTLVEPSSGQARVEALDGLLNNITISVPGGTFHDIILNPFFGSGTANVTVVTATNQVLNFSYSLSNGENFLTIVADPGTSIFSVTINAPGGFTDLRQPRISGAALTTTGSVPEPATMFLFGSGLVGLGAAFRKFRR